jgi:hypothetical protein
MEKLEFENIWIELSRLADLAEYVAANINANEPQSAYRLVTVTDTLVRMVRESNDRVESALARPKP